MSQDSAAALSLLSLSIAASTAQPIPLPDSANASKHPGAQSHHRRLSSTGRRRRLSDARDAASRPLSVGSPGLSMATLSLSTSASPPPSAVSMPASAPAKSSTPIPIAQPASSGGRKKRGVDHKCEACSKIYRHPSCLIKHRWEHTPHWRTLSSLPHPGSNGVLSKHAQVQLLEAAAILSHLSPDSETGTSLPEDRGMWPRWVSGGALEGEEGVPASFESSVGNANVPTSASYTSFTSTSGTSASVGANEYAHAHHGHGHRSASAGGPRLHDYEVPRGAEVRAGVVEVPHAHAHSPSSYTHHGHRGHGHTDSAGSAWSVPRSVSVSASVGSELSRSQSRSRSTPSDDEGELVDGEEDDGEDEDHEMQTRRAYAGRRAGAGAKVWKGEDEEFEFGFDLGGVREEDGEEEYDDEEEGHGQYNKLGKGRAQHQESLRWGGMEEMDDIDMDMD